MLSCPLECLPQEYNFKGNVHSESLVEFDGVDFSYGATPILRNVTIGFPKGKLIAIMGGSGSGKTTLLRLIGGQLRPNRGEVRFEGEAIGAMGLFPRTERRSAGRVPEFADVLTLSLPVFEELTRTVPGYGLAIATVFARRLEGFIKRMRGKKRRKELSGKLKFFDLPTVVQTLVTAKQTGVLTITDEDGKTYAEVLLLDGSVDRARCGLLEGAEAVYQLFHNDDNGEFFFRTVREPDPESISKIRISMSAMNLLMEAMRLMDEAPSVRRRLPDPDKPYQARVIHLEWEDDATVAIAQEVLEKLREPRAIADLIDEVTCSAFTLYGVAAELWESGQIA